MQLSFCEWQWKFTELVIVCRKAPGEPVDALRRQVSELWQEKQVQRHATPAPTSLCRHIAVTLSGRVQLKCDGTW